MKAYCDNAAMQLNAAPYYVDLTSKVATYVTSSSLPAGKPNPKMIMICNGTSDSVVHDVPTCYHNTLASNGVQHVWYTMPGDHNFEVWLNGLYHFSEKIILRF